MGTWLDVSVDPRSPPGPGTSLRFFVGAAVQESCPQPAVAALALHAFPWAFRMENSGYPIHGLGLMLAKSKCNYNQQLHCRQYPFSRPCIHQTMIHDSIRACMHSQTSFRLCIHRTMIETSFWLCIHLVHVDWHEIYPGRPIQNRLPIDEALPIRLRSTTHPARDGSWMVDGWNPQGGNTKESGESIPITYSRDFKSDNMT